MPCVVDEFEGELLVPAYVEFLVDQDPKKYSWLGFTQKPMCNFTVTYTLTSTELTRGEQPFHALREGEFDSHLAFFDNVTHEMTLQSKERTYINREFKFFFNAILHVDPFA